MTDKKLVYIASPYAGDVDYNTKIAKKYCCYAMERGYVPIAPHLLYPAFLDDSNPAERTAGIQMGLRILAVCQELWACGNRISKGMEMEIAESKRLGIPIKYVSQSEMIGVKNMKKYGIWAKRSAASVCGAAEAWLKSDGKPMTFDTYEEAAEKVDSLMKDIGTANVSYFPMEMEQELEEVLSSGMSMKL